MRRRVGRHRGWHIDAQFGQAGYGAFRPRRNINTGDLVVAGYVAVKDVHVSAHDDARAGCEHFHQEEVRGGRDAAAGEQVKSASEA